MSNQDEQVVMSFGVDFNSLKSNINDMLLGKAPSDEASITSIEEHMLKLTQEGVLTEAEFRTLSVDLFYVK